MCNHYYDYGHHDCKQREDHQHDYHPCNHCQNERKTIMTHAGHPKTQDIIIQDMRLSEFEKNRQINQHMVSVFDNFNVQYDIIFGANFLSKAGIRLNYSIGAMEGFDCVITFHPLDDLDSQEFDAMEDMFHIQVEDEPLDDDWFQRFAGEYKLTDVAESLTCYDI